MQNALSTACANYAEPSRAVRWLSYQPAHYTCQLNFKHLAAHNIAFEKHRLFLHPPPVRERLGVQS